MLAVGEKAATSGGAIDMLASSSAACTAWTAAAKELVIFLVLCCVLPCACLSAERASQRRQTSVRPRPYLLHVPWYVRSSTFCDVKKSRSEADVRRLTRFKCVADADASIDRVIDRLESRISRKEPRLCHSLVWLINKQPAQATQLTAQTFDSILLNSNCKIPITF